MTTIYFAGGEDCDHFSGGSGSAISTTSGAFRSSYARCGLQAISSSNGYWQNSLSYVGTPTAFWFSARLAAANNASGTYLLKFGDTSNFTRLQIVTSSGNLIVQKVNTAGTATTLTNTLSAWNGGFSGNTAGTDKLDIHWVNDASGSIDIWLNGNKVFNYSGDTTTETMAIAWHRLSNCGNAVVCVWSEILVVDVDARSFSLQTLAPVSNGNTHNFDTGTPAAANVNETTLSDSTLDGSSSAGQIDQYTIPSLVSGSFSVVAIGVSARMQKGSSGPTKMDLGVRSGSTDYWSSDQVLTTTWAAYQNWWTTDPNTSAAWTALPSNIGLESVA